MLVPRKAFGQETLKVREREVTVGAERDHGHRHLTPLVVRPADHGRLGDRWMCGKDILDLGAVDVLAAGDDHVLLAVHDPDVALFVLAYEIAGMEPATREGLRGGLGVVPV